MESFVQYRKGRAPRRVHADLEGLKDDELSRHGFSGRQAGLYRRWDPSEFRTEGPLRASAVLAGALVADDAGDDRGDPLLLLSNADCRLSLSQRRAPMPFWASHVDADVVLFTHTGTGVLETEFGPLPYRPGDYHHVPRAVVHRVVPDDETTCQLVVESVGELRVPDPGVLGRHYPFDSSTVLVPEPRAYDDDGRAEYEVRLTHGAGEHTSLFRPHHPLDVEGWRGDNFPFALNIADMDVLACDSQHLPPSVHVFLRNDAVWLMSFLPRAAEGRAGTERTPWYHRNADFDEVAFFHGGSMFGLDLPPWLLTHAPQGLQHGVPEGVREEARRTHAELDRVSWEIISIDTRARLTPSPALLAAAGGAA